MHLVREVFAFQDGMRADAVRVRGVKSFGEIKCQRTHGWTQLLFREECREGGIRTVWIYAADDPVNILPQIHVLQFAIFEDVIPALHLVHIQPRLFDGFKEGRIAAVDKLGSQFNRKPAAVDGVNATAETLAGLKDCDRDAVSGQFPGGAQAGNSASDDDDRFRHCDFLGGFRGYFKALADDVQFALCRFLAN